MNLPLFSNSRLHSGLVSSLEHAPAFIVVIVMAVVLGTPFALAAEWYEETTFKSDNVSTEACEAITSGLGKWFTKPDPFTLRGHPATGRLYASLLKTNGVGSPFSIIEQHKLTPTEGSSLAGFYQAEAGAHVPYLLQLGAAAFPAQLGTSLTLLDWLTSSGASASTANEVAVLIRSGGVLTRSMAVRKDEDQHPWLLIQTTFGTSVSDQNREYAVCSAAYPLKE